MVGTGRCVKAMTEMKAIAQFITLKFCLHYEKTTLLQLIENIISFVTERPNIPEEVRISEVWSRRARVTWRVARGALVSHYSLQYRALTRDLTNAPLDAPLPALLDTWDAPEVLNLTLANSDLLHVA